MQNYKIIIFIYFRKANRAKFDVILIYFFRICLLFLKQTSNHLYSHQFELHSKAFSKIIDPENIGFDFNILLFVSYLISFFQDLNFLIKLPEVSITNLSRTKRTTFVSQNLITFTIETESSVIALSTREKNLLPFKCLLTKFAFVLVFVPFSFKGLLRVVLGAYFNRALIQTSFKNFLNLRNIEVIIPRL